MTLYRVDIRDKAAGNKVVAKGLDIETDMWGLPEALLLAKLGTATREMAAPENKDKLRFRRPLRDYEATVRKVTQIVIEIEQTVTTRG